MQSIVHIAIDVDDYNKLVALDVTFISEPAEHEYGTVAVFEDLYGNLWDLIEHKEGHRYSQKSRIDSES